MILKCLAKVLPGRPSDTEAMEHHPSGKYLGTMLLTTEIQDSSVFAIMSETVEFWAHVKDSEFHRKSSQVLYHGCAPLGNSYKSLMRLSQGKRNLPNRHAPSQGPFSPSTFPGALWVGEGE